MSQALTGICMPSWGGGYVLMVLTNDDSDTDQDPVMRLHLPDWDSFRPASAGHRLIEQGYMIAPGIDRSYLAGWKQMPGEEAYHVRVVPCEDVTGA